MESPELLACRHLTLYEASTSSEPSLLQALHAARPCSLSTVDKILCSQVPLFTLVVRQRWLTVRLCVATALRTGNLCRILRGFYM